METFQEHPGVGPGGPRPEVTAALTRGALRLFLDLGLSPLTEFRLPNGRRADVAALDPKGRLVFAEIKSSREDFEADGKWPDYLGFCDAFYFVVDEAFPKALLPNEEGLIIADAFGGAVVRQAPSRPLAPARRKALTLRFARIAASRLVQGTDVAVEAI
ncbi:MAG: DNA repair putative endonuclease MmcB [Pseudomonadota bacterium]